MELDTANKANRNWLEGMVAPTDGMLNFPGILRSVAELPRIIQLFDYSNS